MKREYEIQNGLSEKNFEFLKFNKHATHFSRCSFDLSLSFRDDRSCNKKRKLIRNWFILIRTSQNYLRLYKADQRTKNQIIASLQWQELQSMASTPTGTRRQNVQPVFFARKYAAGVKRSKLCHWYQARENIEPVQSAGNHAAGARTCHRYKARENMSPLPSAGKRTDTKRGKTENQYRG